MTTTITWHVVPDASKLTRYERVVLAQTKVCTRCNGDIVRRRDEYNAKHESSGIEGEDDEIDRNRPYCSGCSSTGMMKPNLVRCPACHGKGEIEDEPKCRGCNGTGVALLNLTADMKKNLVKGLRQLANDIETDSVVMRSMLVVDETKQQQECSHWALIEWCGRTAFPAPPTQRRYELAERIGGQILDLAAKLEKQVAKL
jgi:hypothetical protein